MEHAADQAAGSTITVRFYAGAAEAAGAEELRLPLPGPRESAEPGDPAGPQPLDAFLTTLPDLVRSAAGAGRPASSAPSLERVCSRSSFLVNGVRAARGSGTLSPGDQLDILPPFAGG